MSQKQNKKIKKMYRKMFEEELHKQFDVLRPKPKWVPAFTWKLIYSIVFKEKI